MLILCRSDRTLWLSMSASSMMITGVIRFSRAQLLILRWTLLIFSKTGVSTQSGSNLPVEIQNRQGGKAVISHFEKRVIEGRGPHPRGS